MTGQAPAAGGYGQTARLLHWLVAALVVGVVALGWAMVAAPRNTPARDALLLWHRSLGLVILTAMLVRLLWRWRHPPPRLPPSVARIEVVIARATQALLYTILIAMPATGYLNATAAGHPVNLFGVASLPPHFERSGRVAQAAIAIHLAGQYLVYFLVSLHIAGALYHGVFRRDGVLELMLPGRARRGASITPARLPRG